MGENVNTKINVWGGIKIKIRKRLSFDIFKNRTNLCKGAGTNRLNE